MATEFRLLGPVEVHAAGRVVDIGPARQQGVLAALLCDVNRPVSVDHLVERVWGEQRLPERPRNTVYTYISLLNRSLADVAKAVIVRRTHGYMIELDDEQVDLHRFRSLVEKARSTRDGAVALFEQAFSLWRGEAFAMLDTPWAQSTRRALKAERVAAESELTDVQLSLGRHATLLAALAERCAADPLDERLAGQLILALFRSGRQADALHHYHRIRRQLAEELGTDPGHTLRALYERILTDDPALVVTGADPVAEAAPPTYPPTRAAAGPAVPRQLPADVQGFVGRLAQLGQLDALLGESEGVGRGSGYGAVAAVFGSAGAGKTGLAVHWAHAVARRFPDGALYADLRGFAESGRPLGAGEVIRDFLETLGVPSASIPTTLAARAALYRSVLAGRRILVVLDNARDADQVRPLLPGAATAFTLVTSRDQLISLIAANGARPLAVDLLSRGEARELLARRLGEDVIAAHPGAVREIIDSCAGLPLALTIAAARAQQTGFPLDALAAELGPAGRRLDALDGGDPASQLRAVFSWSYATLSPLAARLFRYLATGPSPGAGGGPGGGSGAVVGPGADLSVVAAASVAALSPREARRLLGELTRASLLIERAPGCYACHDLLLAYARELFETHDAGRQP